MPSDSKELLFFNLFFNLFFINRKGNKMTTSDTNTMPQPAYIYYAYVLSYQYDLARFIELFADKDKAFDRLCELGKGCIVTVNNVVVWQG